MKIVMLERNSLGVDIDVSRFADFGPFEEYPVSVLNDTAEKVKDAEVIIVNKVPMDQRTLSEASNLKLICETATGTDNIDLEYCRSRGITVTNVKGYSTDTVAQHTFALLFYVMEKLRWYDDYVKSGEYSNQPRFSNFDQTFFEMKGRTWGIIGLGEIGRSVASIATAFGMNVIYYSASGRSYDVPYKCVDFDTLLKNSDIVSIHAPLNEDLARALNENKIAGAGLDVLGVEPMDKNNPLGRIQDSRKLIITPHMAWASVEARERLVNEVYENLKAYCADEERSVVR